MTLFTKHTNTFGKGDTLKPEKYFHEMMKSNLDMRILTGQCHLERAG